MRNLLLCLMLLGVLSTPGALSGQVRLGPTLLLQDDTGFGIGASVSIPAEQLQENLSFNATAGYYLAEGASWVVDGDVVYSFPVSSDAPFEPFASVGLNLWGFSDTDVGLNVGGGIVLASSSLSPFLKGKFEVHDEGTVFVLLSGISFAIGD